ncbi:MAG TPA: hypothetical protein VG370_26665 [Chloroflexota bacterium]|nr:hypothetical protein [Chloroflexota bacterium]
MLATRVADLPVHNGQFARTHEWTSRLLEAQEPGRLPAPPPR